MTRACDDESPYGGCEQEEPKEPPRAPHTYEECFVRVYGGYRRLRDWIDSLKPVIYSYNESIKDKGFYLKPVHKVYYTMPTGERRIYEYSGRYWWKLGSRNGRRVLSYAGKTRPRGLPEPPKIELEGVRVIVEGDDVIIECDLYDRVKSFFEGLKTVRV